MASQRLPDTGNWRLILVLLWLGVVGCQTQPRPLVLESASVDAVHNAVAYLASDELEGRGPGTAGLDLAAEYIAGHFEGLGLKPVPGQTSYFQPFTYSSITGVSTKTFLRAGDRRYSTYSEFVPFAFSADAGFAGAVAFAGYGITADKTPSGSAYDDYAGLDARGRIALVLRYEPHDARGRSRFAPGDWSRYATLEEKARNAAAHGAVAVMVVNPPEFHGIDMLTRLDRSSVQTTPIPILQVHQKVADELLRQSGAGNLRSFQNAIDGSFAPRSFILKNVQVEGNVAIDRASYHLKNVAAFRPGKGRHAGECIVIGAHYDHLGYGPRPFTARLATTAPSKIIFHGADDNASGTAAVLELARIFSQASAPQRSILFVCFSGEERGLIGSQYWVDHPLVPLDRVVAMVNIDMLGRIRDGKLSVGGGGTSAVFPQIIEHAGAGIPLKLERIWNDGKAPSDCTSFVNYHIPSLFFFSGVHSDLHRPTDTADKINCDGEAAAVNLIAQVVRDLAEQPSIGYITPPPTATSRPSTRPAGRPTTRPDSSRSR